MNLISTLHILPRVLSAKAISSRRARRGQKLEPFSIFSETEIRTFYEGPVFDPLGIRPGIVPQRRIPSFGIHPGSAPLNVTSLLGNTFELDVDPSRSFFGDAINIIDAPEEARVDPRFPPFGWSGKSLTGGFALTGTPLSGKVVLHFAEEVVGGYLTLRITHPRGLRGLDSSLNAPGDFSLPTRSNVVTDSSGGSHALVEVSSGRLFDFHYNVSFFNSAIIELLSVNPALRPPPLLFPGVPHGGHALGHVRLLDGKLRLSILAQIFLPLDHEAKGQAIRMPASQGGRKFREPFTARNSSLHPFIQMSASSELETKPKPTTAQIEPDWARRLRMLQNQRLTLTCLPPLTNFGDEFNLKSSKLGGFATGMSPLIGDLAIQFGVAENDRLPYVLTFHSPSPAFDRRLQPLLQILPPGTQPGLIGLQGFLSFPKQDYLQSELSFCSDPQKVSVSLVNLADEGGQHEIVLRKFLFVSVMRKLIAVEPRTPTDSWTFVSDACFSLTNTGHLVYRADGALHIPYPPNYGFPFPSGMRMQIEAGSFLTPFAHIWAIESSALAPIDDLRFSFSADQIVRGKPRRNLNVSATSVGGTVQWTMTWTGGTLQGAAASGVSRYVALDDGTLCISSSFVPRSRPNSEVQVWAKCRGRSIDLLTFSTDERADIWVKGMGDAALNVTPA